jgi:hypothetical protein
VRAEFAKILRGVRIRETVSRLQRITSSCQMIRCANILAHYLSANKFQNRNPQICCLLKKMGRMWRGDTYISVFKKVEQILNSKLSEVPKQYFWKMVQILLFKPMALGLNNIRISPLLLG